MRRVNPPVPTEVDCGLRSGQVRAGVEDGVQFWVVVHLHLTVKPEPALSGENLRPEFIETARQVRALLGQNGQTMLVAAMMLVRSGWAMDLFGGVIDLESENRKPVDDEAWRLGVKRGGLVLRTGKTQQQQIDLFDEVVTLLVVPIDRVFDLGDASVGGVWTTGLILFVP